MALESAVRPRVPLPRQLRPSPWRDPSSGDKHPTLRKPQPGRQGKSRQRVPRERCCRGCFRGLTACSSLAASPRKHRTFWNGRGIAMSSTTFFPFTSTTKLPLSGLEPSFGCTSIVTVACGFAALISACHSRIATATLPVGGNCAIVLVVRLCGLPGAPCVVLQRPGKPSTKRCSHLPSRPRSLLSSLTPVQQPSPPSVRPLRQSTVSRASEP